MKKTVIILLTLAVLSATSCRLAIPQEPGRTVWQLKWTTNNYTCLSVRTPSGIMNNCILADDYLKANEGQRENPEYSSVIYNPSDNAFKIAELDSIITDGKELYAASAEWTVLRGGDKYLVRCIGDSLWSVSCDHQVSDSEVIKTISTLSLNKRDNAGFCTWQCAFSGVDSEKDIYSATFRSEEDFSVKWDHQYSGSSIYSSIVYSGVASSVFFVNGNETDWCRVTFEDGEFKEVTSSQD